MPADRTTATADQAVAAAIESAKTLRNEARAQSRLIILAADAEAAQIRHAGGLEEITVLAADTERTLARGLDQLTAELTALSEWTAEMRGPADSLPAVEAPVPTQWAKLGRSIAYWTLVVAVSLALVVALIFFFESRDVSSLEP